MISARLVGPTGEELDSFLAERTRVVRVSNGMPCRLQVTAPDPVTLRIEAQDGKEIHNRKLRPGDEPIALQDILNYRSGLDLGPVVARLRSTVIHEPGNSRSHTTFMAIVETLDNTRLATFQFQLLPTDLYEEAHAKYQRHRQTPAQAAHAFTTDWATPSNSKRCWNCHKETQFYPCCHCGADGK